MTETFSRTIAQTAVELPPLTAIMPDVLAPLLDMVGDARIVAIGESFHHTHEQLALREHLVRTLVSAGDFNRIFLEVVTPGPNAINAFVEGGVGDSESALIATGARMWRNHETAALLSWLRAWNRNGRSAQVSVHGIDVLAIGPLMRAALARSHSAEQRHIEALSHAFDIDGRADQAAYNQLSAVDRDILHRAFEQALTMLPDPLDPTREQAVVVLDALEMLRAGSRGWTEGFPLRDHAMANAAHRLIERAPAADKFIILSHNTHIAAQAPLTAPSHAPMGAFLRERYGDAYFALGLAFGRASFAPPIYGVTNFDTQPGCIDQYFAALGYPAALLSLRGHELGHRLRLQGVGAGPDPYTEYPSLHAFDALAYVDVLTNARQLVDTELGLDTDAVDATRP